MIMRRLLPLFIVCGTLAAEDITIQSGGGVSLVPDLPGFVRIAVNDNPAATHLVRVGAISYMQVPRSDRPGDVISIFVPMGTDVLRFHIPVRHQAVEAVVLALGEASLVRQAPAR